MKASNYCYQEWNWRDRIAPRAAIMAILFGLVPILLVSAAAWAGAAHTGPDPILAGPAPGPCASLTAGADYMGGTDASGHPVAPADLGDSPRVRLDSETVYADVGAGRHDGMANVAVDVTGLAKGMAAAGACARVR